MTAANSPRTSVSEELCLRILDRLGRCLAAGQGDVLAVRKGAGANELTFVTPNGDTPCRIMEDDGVIIFDVPNDKNGLWVPKDDLLDAISTPKRGLVMASLLPTVDLMLENKRQGNDRKSLLKRRVVSIDRAFGWLLGLSPFATSEAQASNELLCVRMAMRKPRYEYNCVCRTTQQPRLLLEAHLTKMTEANALALIELLTEHRRCERPKVTWGKRGWAIFDQHRIQLPPPPRCSAGIVVHEFAHLATPHPDQPRPRRPHGPAFVETLDQLLTVSWPLWQPSNLDLNSELEFIAIIYDKMVAHGRMKPVRTVTPKLAESDVAGSITHELARCGHMIEG